MKIETLRTMLEGMEPEITVEIWDDETCLWRSLEAEDLRFRIEGKELVKLQEGQAGT